MASAIVGVEFGGMISYGYGYCFIYFWKDRNANIAVLRFQPNRKLALFLVPKMT